ncbi:LysM peptidoglycan-binding domain-containing protein [Dehalobacter sp. DCM]|uniref:LysM peptidoglycan-binding domain-containing protein n=1 Tax=Dehalobacter sp. DCM TaxID=2907827 RepID=UPI0030816DD9|nr:LysM peptidoglycan-binding domain-containing protein [Dehalobacter sp. DCM]
MKRIALIAIIFLIIMIAVPLVSTANSTVPDKSATLYYKAVTVQQGDTLWGLTAESNNVTNINELVTKTMKYNSLHSTYIEPGQVIYVAVRI